MKWDDFITAKHIKFSQNLRWKISKKGKKNIHKKPHGKSSEATNKDGQDAAIRPSPLVELSTIH